MFSPITAADNIRDEFIGYISTLFHISDKDYAAQFAAALREEGAIAKGPYLDVSDSYKTGKSLAQMIEEGEASSLFHSLEGDIPDGEKEIQINRGLYLHQERALRKTNKGKNLIVTTGTGSGKTECFIIPIINHLLREAEEGTLSSGVRAILIYPMNALANDQMKRLRNLLKSYPEITFGVYNSSTKQNEQDGIAEYGKVYKDANGRPLKPLKNEIVSRDQMQKTPPHILVTNYAMLEYIFAVALSDFFAKQVDVYNSNNADVLLSGDGWERFCAYLSSKPEHLKDVLKASIPESMHRVMGINDFSWTEKLVGKDGVLKVAVDEFRGTVQYYIDEYRRLLAEGLTQQAAAVEKKLWSYRRGKEDNRGRNELIEFLVRNNVLPKYGFPVDTVELYQNTNAATDKKLQMVRDLQLAISEYAPDSQVVADGKLYTSRYIRKLPQTTGQDWETAYIAQCNNPSCMTWNHRLMEPDEGGEPCVSCHEIISKSRWKQAIEPRKGFVADAKPKDVPMRKPDKAFRSDDFYIGDAQRQVMQKYAFVMKDGNRFQMETSINDSLMVVCNDDFYVCPHCGYAESTMENMEVAGFNSHQKTLEKKHITPWGKNCEVKLVKNKLCHVFKTDVVRLVFSTPQAGNQEVMLSVMYALLEALSSVMDIERNDIKGCLHKIVYDNKLIYAIVLYDAVAGGAGHVRRLVTEDGRCFRQVVEKAIAITKGCNCSPSCYSCLRNYYNQKIHDLLNRKYAYDFLENYYGELEPITNEEFENGELYNV